MGLRGLLVPRVLEDARKEGGRVWRGRRGLAQAAMVYALVVFEGILIFEHLGAERAADGGVVEVHALHVLPQVAAA